MTYNVTLREFARGGWVSTPIKSGFKSLDTARRFAYRHAKSLKYFDGVEVYIAGKRESQGEVFHEYGAYYWRKWGEEGRKVTEWMLDSSGNLIPNTKHVHY